MAERGMERTYLCNGYDLSIGAPASLLEKLWYLRRLSTSSLPNNDSDLASLDQVEQALLVLRYGQESRRFVKRWNK